MNTPNKYIQKGMSDQRPFSAVLAIEVDKNKNSDSYREALGQLFVDKAKDAGLFDRIGAEDTDSDISYFPEIAVKAESLAWADHYDNMGDMPLNKLWDRFVEGAEAFRFGHINSEQFDKWITPTKTSALKPVAYNLHRITPNDTLSKLAEKYHTTVEEILKENPVETSWWIKNPDTILPNGLMRIPSRIYYDEPVPYRKSGGLGRLEKEPEPITTEPEGLKSVDDEIKAKHEQKRVATKSTWRKVLNQISSGIDSIYTTVDEVAEETFSKLFGKDEQKRVAIKPLTIEDLEYKDEKTEIYVKTHSPPKGKEGQSYADRRVGVKKVFDKNPVWASTITRLINEFRYKNGIKDWNRDAVSQLFPQGKDTSQTVINSGIEGMPNLSSGEINQYKVMLDKDASLSKEEKKGLERLLARAKKQRLGHSPSSTHLGWGKAVALDFKWLGKKNHSAETMNKFKDFLEDKGFTVDQEIEDFKGYRGTGTVIGKHFYASKNDEHYHIAFEDKPYHLHVDNVPKKYWTEESD